MGARKCPRARVRVRPARRGCEEAAARGGAVPPRQNTHMLTHTLGRPSESPLIPPKHPSELTNQAGVHQAIEAKEGVPIKPEARATASITFQARRPRGALRAACSVRVAGVEWIETARRPRMQTGAHGRRLKPYILNSHPQLRTLNLRPPKVFFAFTASWRA